MEQNIRLVCLFVLEQIQNFTFSERLPTLYMMSQAFILTCRVDTLYFDDHFNAYCVERADSYSAFPIKELVYYRQFSTEMCEKHRLCHIVILCDLCCGYCKVSAGFYVVCLFEIQVDSDYNLCGFLCKFKWHVLFWGVKLGIIN